MKMPKTVKRYCPTCRKHTEHRVSQAKKKTPGTAHPMSYGGKRRMKLRGRARGHGNLGRMSKGAVSGWKRYGKKQSKKTDFRLKCKECGKTHVQRKNFRSKRIEFK